jgi:predicted nucleotidyltransferase
VAAGSIIQQCAATARAEIVSRLDDEVSRLSPAPTVTALFGSFARREAGVESDIDLLIVVADDTDVHGMTWTEQIDALVQVMTRWTGNRLAPLVLTEATFASAIANGEPLIGSLRVEALPLTGHEVLRQLLDDAAARRPRRRPTTVMTP